VSQHRGTDVRGQGGIIRNMTEKCSLVCEDFDPNIKM